MEVTIPFASLVAYSVFLVFLGYMLGMIRSDREWEPEWRVASDGWERNVVARLKEKKNELRFERIDDRRCRVITPNGDGMIVHVAPYGSFSKKADST